MDTDSTPPHSHQQGSREFKFEEKTRTKKANLVGTLKLSEKDNFIYLYFDGVGLKKGNYKIVKTEDCTSLKNQLRSKKPLKDENEIYSFETKYGNISGEKNLSFKNFQELGLEHSSFALIKIEKKEALIISCLSK
jgi:hypothetical protein